MEEKTLKVNESGGKPGRSRRNKAARAAGTVFRILFLAGVSLVIGVNIYVLNAKKIGGNRLPMPFGYGAAVVMSGSMEPVLNVGDLVFVKEVSELKKKAVKPDSINKGDIVVYEPDNSSGLIIHRVIEKCWDEDRLSFITRGDANNSADDPVYSKYIKGVLVCKNSIAGSLVLWLKNPFVIAGLIIASVLIVEIGNARAKERDNEEILKLRREIEELKGEHEQKQ